MTYKAASGHPSGKWRVIEEPDPTGICSHRELYIVGTYRMPLYKTHQAARRKAFELNIKECVQLERALWLWYSRSLRNVDKPIEAREAAVDRTLIWC